MRNHVIDCITEMAKTNDRIYVVTADLGYNVLDDFRVKYPDRFVNVGIAEQNMTAVAAGMALEDNMVFTYSIGNFPTLRCIEQIRNDVCYHNANVNRKYHNVNHKFFSSFVLNKSLQFVF